MITLAVALILCAAIIGAAYLRAPVIRDVPTVGPIGTGPAAPAAPAPAPAPTFDQHAGMACALLDPDPALPDDGAALIGRVVADAVDQLASAIAADRAGLAPDVVDRHRDRAFTALYRSLTGAELTRALLAALAGQAEERALVLVNQFRSLPTAHHREESR